MDRKHSRQEMDVRRVVLAALAALTLGLDAGAAARELAVDAFRGEVHVVFAPLRDGEVGVQEVKAGTGAFERGPCVLRPQPLHSEL